jgi:hypothetical protein
MTSATLARSNSTCGQIAIRNDVFRRRGLGYMLTDDVVNLPDVCRLIKAVQNYSDFDYDNDPHVEHDFGSLDWHGNKVFWKIDYYDPQMEQWEDPHSSRYNRVLTVMLASEY